MNSLITFTRPAMMRSMGVRYVSGTVKWFNVTKGYGFVTPDAKAGEEVKDVFAHQTAIKGEGFRFLKEGERVQFDLESTQRGSQAVNIRDPAGKPFVRASIETN